VRFVCLATLLAASTALAAAQGRVDPAGAVAAWGPSVLHQQQPWALSPPATGSDEPKKRVRTITIRPDGAPEPAPPGRYYVQLTAQRTSQEAQDRFDEMQERFPGALRDRTSVILRTEAGVSVVYRAMVGPFGDLAAATGMCDGLKAQGGQCVVHKLEPEQ
jgi:hypothetical protein